MTGDAAAAQESARAAAETAQAERADADDADASRSGSTGRATALSRGDWRQALELSRQAADGKAACRDRPAGCGCRIRGKP